MGCKKKRRKHRSKGKPLALPTVVFDNWKALTVGLGPRRLGYLARRISGESFSQIAVTEGMTRQAISNVVRTALRRMSRNARKLNIDLGCDILAISKARSTAIATRDGKFSWRHTRKRAIACRLNTLKKALKAGPNAQAFCWKTNFPKAGCDFCGAIYRRWAGIVSRCTDTTTPAYRWYGARGITVCEEWLNSFNAFRLWCLSNGFACNLQIDRRDGNLGYSPDNCRFVTSQQNCWNCGKTRKVGSGLKQSKYKGVSWWAAVGCRARWKAAIRVNRKSIHLGLFDNEEDAARAYDAAVLRHRDPQYAYLNFPDVNAAK
jgi:hypothetical protein